MEACMICAEDVWADTKVACSYCGFAACGECVKTFIVLSDHEPTCMGCKKVWSREYVMEKFDKPWVRESFLPHLGKIIKEEEKALLPDTQHEAALVVRIREYIAKIKNLPTDAQLKRKFKSKPDVMYEELLKKRETRNLLNGELYALKQQTETYGADLIKPAAGREEEKKKKKYVFKCPFDDCRGFVSTEYSCGTCERSVCGNCHKPLLTVSDANARHKCDDDDVQTATLVKNETKPCPKCATLIFKASGCNQIFCTQCHIAFDWLTLKIDNGIIHNPHYYEFLASQASATRAAIDVERIACGDVPRTTEFINHVTWLSSSSSSIDKNWREVVTFMYELHRTALHLRQVILPQYSLDRIKTNLDLRVQYLLGDIDDEAWTRKLIHRQKRHLKFRATSNLVQMIVVVLEDFVRQVYSMDASVPDAISKVIDILEQYSSVQKYYAKSIETIIDTHGGGIPKDLHIF